ncbi:MAG: inositol monophosphatase family protein [Candidatus Babeliales bacterium]
MNWQKKLEPIVRHAGTILLSYYGKKLAYQEKKAHGFVTEADRSSENYLIKELQNFFPEASFFAEESGQLGKSDYCWVIDPLDGTTNFVHTLPYFCISIALTYKEKPQVGIVYQPLTKEFFFAEKGKGAFLNGNHIKVSSPDHFNKSLIAMGLSYKSQQKNKLLRKGEKITQQAYGVRHFGAIALDLAYIACGRLDGLFLTYLAWWDVAAGILLIEEAGGKIADFSGQPLAKGYTSCIAGGRMVYSQMQQILED